MMILVDPNLGPDLDPARRPPSKTTPKGARAGQPSAERLPAPRTLTRFLHAAQQAVRLRGQVSVLLTTDKAIRTLNRKFRGKNKATDVLSFPAEAGLPEEVAGDLAISVETARRQAAEQGHTLACELKVLMLHGLLHLAGYDHEADDGRMARRERKLRAELGLPLGLIERASSPTLSPEKRRKNGARASRARVRRPALQKATGPSRRRRP